MATVQLTPSLTTPAVIREEEIFGYTAAEEEEVIVGRSMIEGRSGGRREEVVGVGGSEMFADPIPLLGRSSDNASDQLRAAAKSLGRSHNTGGEAKGEGGGAHGNDMFADPMALLTESSDDEEQVCVCVCARV